MTDTIRISAPATSANLGPGFDVLAMALDLANEVVVTPRPGPLEVVVTGEGEGELPADGTNVVCQALAHGLGVQELTDLRIECNNRIPLGRGLGSSAAAICSGLVAANALGVLRWAPDDLLARAAALDGHADNVAACINGGVVAVRPGPTALQLPSPDDLLFVAVVPEGRLSTADARAALPPGAAVEDVRTSMGNAIALALAFERGDFQDLPELLVDRLHEPHRAALVPGLAELRALVGHDGCRGATISGSGPTVLLWCDRSAAAAVAERATAAMAATGAQVQAKVLRIAPGGIRCRWEGASQAPPPEVMG